MSERLFSKAPTDRELKSEAQELLAHPPQLILVFDNWRGESEKAKELTRLTIRTRALVAATIYFSPLYQNRQRPEITCFAGEHTPNSLPGSMAVHKELIRLTIPVDNIVLRTNTVTTRSDILELLAYAHAQGYESVGIVTTDDHRVRTMQEWQNHFSDFAKKKRKIKRGQIFRPRLYVFSRRSTETQQVRDSYVHRTEPPPRQLMQAFIEIFPHKLDGGITEMIAIILANIPIRNWRLFLQNIAEKRYIPKQLARIKNAAAAIATASKKNEKDEKAWQATYPKSQNRKPPD